MTDPHTNHARRRKLLATISKLATNAAPPANGQGSAAQTATFFLATVVQAEPGYSDLYQVQHVSGEVYRGVPRMTHVTGLGAGTLVSVRKIGNRLIIDGVPTGNADTFTG